VAAVRNARRNRVQLSLNLAYGSAMASIGLTIPTVAVAMFWLAGPLELGLTPTQHQEVRVVTGRDPADSAE
jgi:Ca2+:H+ antiporter